MQDRMSLFVAVDGPLHRLNPLTKLTAVFTLILVAFLGPGLYLPLGLFLLVVVPLAIVGKVWRPFVKTASRILLPIILFLFVMQAFFYPGGETVFFKIWVLEATIEGVMFAFVLVTRIAVLVSSFLVMLLTTHPSTLMSDLAQRGLPGALPYVITSTFQIVPQMQVKAATIIDAQRARGFETEGSIRNRVRSLLPLVGPLVFGSLVDVEERTIAIEARGFTVPGKKTSLFEIPDSRIEKIFRWLCLAIIILTIGSRLWLSFR